MMSWVFTSGGYEIDDDLPLEPQIYEVIEDGVLGAMVWNHFDHMTNDLPDEFKPHITKIVELILKEKK